MTCTLTACAALVMCGCSGDATSAGGSGSAVASGTSAVAPASGAPSIASVTSAAAAGTAAPTTPPAPEGMVYVGPATFDAVVGGGSVVRSEVRGFFIDKEKVTNGAFKKCYEDRACVVASASSLDFLKPNLVGGPVTNIAQGEARAFCKSVGKRLPSAAEWQLAARGPEGRTFPWGNEEPAACSPPDCKPVRVKTPEGLIGMAGMLWEMSDGDVCFVKAAKPELCTQKAAVIHGGAWNTSATSFKVLEVHDASSVPASTVSFRCVKDAG